MHRLENYDFLNKIPFHRESRSGIDDRKWILRDLNHVTKKSKKMFKNLE